jgi:predicted nuclease of predicted toxin-antitoxin system
LLNEHLSPELAEALRGRGFDVVSCLEVGLGRADDGVLLAHATAEGRAVVTFNARDFAPLHEQLLANGQEHWGIILSTQETFGVLLKRLLRLLHSVSAEEMKNQLHWLNEFK